jgi:hypothetical protein
MKDMLEIMAFVLIVELFVVLFKLIGGLAV